MSCLYSLLYAKLGIKLRLPDAYLGFTKAFIADGQVAHASFLRIADWPHDGIGHAVA